MNKPPSMVDRPSARKALPSVCWVVGLPVSLPMARQLPVVSAMITSIARVMIKMGINENSGAPKAIGGLSSNQAASPTRLKLVMPKAAAIKLPANKPMSTLRLPIKPENLA
ncbi:hypothetical protein D3C78_1504240 [compost metagenome]